MNWEQHISDNRRDLDQNQIRQMVKESYYDIEVGKGRDCRDFFCELEKRLVNEENMVLKSRASERLLAILKEGEDSAEDIPSSILGTSLKYRTIQKWGYAYE